MASEKVTFAKNYDHIWPSRVQTAFKAGYSGTVKAEVAEGARRVGALDEGETALPTTRDELEKLAKAEGIDVAAIEGTGARGQVVNDDISAAITSNRAAKASEPGDTIGSGGPSGAEAPTE